MILSRLLPLEIVFFYMRKESKTVKKKMIALILTAVLLTSVVLCGCGQTAHLVFSTRFVWICFLNVS